MVSTSGAAAPASGVVLDNSTSSGSNGTASMVLGSDSSSVSGGVGEERPVDPPPAADTNWVEVQRRKKATRGESRVGGKTWGKWKELKGVVNILIFSRHLA